MIKLRSIAMATSNANLARLLATSDRYDRAVLRKTLYSEARAEARRIAYVHGALAARIDWPPDVARDYPDVIDEVVADLEADGHRVVRRGSGSIDVHSGHKSSPAPERRPPGPLPDHRGAIDRAQDAIARAYGGGGP